MVTKAKKNTAKAVQPDQNPEPQATAEQGVKPEILVTDVPVICLQGLPTPYRSVVLAFLADSGYIWPDLTPVFNKIEDLNHEYIALDHNHKIAKPVNKEEASAYPVSYLGFDGAVKITFSEPDHMYQNTVQIGNAIYQRIA